MRIVSSALVTICLYFLSITSVSAQPEAQGQKYQPQRAFLAWPERVEDGITVVFPQGVCRLAGLDAPALPQRQPGEPMGQVRAKAELAEQSRRALEGLLGQASAVVVDFGPDRRGRMICLVQAATGENVNLEMVRSGWAEAYLLPGTPFAVVLREAEERAWEAKRGLWGFPHYRRARDERKRLRGGSAPSERSAPNYWDTLPTNPNRKAPPCVDPSCK